MSDAPPNCYPWSADGQLCPVLREPDVWMKVFDTPRRKHLVKGLSKDFGYKGIIRKNEVETFGRAAVFLMNKPSGRQALTELLKKNGLNPLHWQIFDAFHQRNAELAGVMPLKDFCAGDLDKGAYLDVALFQGWLAQRRYSAEQSRALALVGCAYAILQPEDAPVACSPNVGPGAMRVGGA